jgi:hypothetical protein
MEKFMTHIVEVFGESGTGHFTDAKWPQRAKKRGWAGCGVSMSSQA